MKYCGRLANSTSHQSYDTAQLEITIVLMWTNITNSCNKKLFFDIAILAATASSYKHDASIKLKIGRRSSALLSNCDAHTQVSASRNTVIVKLGGSAITVKDTFETLRDDSLNSTANQIRQLLQENYHINLVVVHGAGSFGHFQVR